MYTHTQPEINIHRERGREGEREREREREGEREGERKDGHNTC